MEFNIIFTNEDNDYALKQARLLKNWILDSEIDGIDLSLKHKELQKDDAAAGIAEGIIAVSLGAPSVVILAQAIHTWIKEKSKQKLSKLSITLKKGDMEIVINSENAIKSEEYIIKTITKLLD